MENNGFEITDKEMYDSMITAKIYLQEALKCDEKTLRERIEGIISMFEKAEEMTNKINQNGAEQKE